MAFFSPLLALDADSAETLTTIILIASVASLIATFKDPKTMYWLGLIGLYIQSLLWVYMFDAIVAAFTQHGNVHGWSDGQKAALVLSMLPFLIPAGMAWLTASVTANPLLGVASFTFYSIVQIVVHGMASEQENFTNRVLAGAKLALPILSFLISLMRALGGS